MPLQNDVLQSCKPDTEGFIRSSIQYLYICSPRALLHPTFFLEGLSTCGHHATPGRVRRLHRSTALLNLMADPLDHFIGQHRAFNRE